MSAYLSGAAPEADAMVRTWFEGGYPVAVQMLNLGRDWVSSFLAHIFSKVNRVSFGLLHQQDFDLWDQLEASPASDGGAPS